MSKKGSRAGCPNTKPSQAFIREVWRTLQQRARAGDLEAMETLLRLTSNKPRHREAHPLDGKGTG